MAEDGPAGRPAHAGWRLAEAVAFALVLAAALAIRCYRIEDESLWFDEATSVQYLDAPSFGEFVLRERPEDPAMAPFYFLLEFHWARLFPEHLVVAERGLSIAFGLGAVALACLIARRVYGPWAGVIAAACAAVAIQNVYYSQEIRMYAPCLFFACAGMYALVRVLEGDGLAWWIVAGLANAAMVWTHLYGAVLVLTQGVFVVAARWRNRRLILEWAAVHAPIVFSIAMWVTTTNPEHIKNNLSWIPSPISGAATEFVSNSGLAVTRDVRSWTETVYLPQVVKVSIAVFWVILVSIALIRAIRWRHVAGAHKNPEGEALMLTWLALPAITLLVLSIVWRPTFLPRYVLPSTIALYVVMAGALVAIRRPWVRAVLACLLVALYAYDTYEFGLPRRPDVRSAVAAIEAEYQPGERVLICPSGYNIAAAHYGRFTRDDFDVCRNWRDLPGKAAEAVREKGTAWIILGDLKGIPPDIRPLLEAEHLDYTRDVFPGAFEVWLLRVRAGHEPQ